MFCPQAAAKTERRSWRTILFIVSVGMIANCGAVSAKAPRHIRKFDIFCSTSGYRYKTFHPELVGYASLMPERWFDDFRYRIDLNAGTYTDIGPKLEKTMKIASSTRRIITFSKTSVEQVIFNLRTRRFRATGTLGPYSDGVEAGPCRFARYSGR
jgi:hypothetical protein